MTTKVFFLIAIVIVLFFTILLLNYRISTLRNLCQYENKISYKYRRQLSRYMEIKAFMQLAITLILAYIALDCFHLFQLALIILLLGSIYIVATITVAFH